MNIRSYLPPFLRRLPLPYLIGGGAVIVVAVFFGIRHFTASAPETAAQTDTVPHVQVATVADLSGSAGPLSLVGTVTSEDQATVLAETSGELTSLPHAIGDYVSAGAVIGSFENSSQRAAVLQAQGAYDGARAALQKATSTTATNSGISSASASQGAANAAASLQAALRSAYSSLDDAVHTRTDALFSNPRSVTPQFNNFTVPDTQLVTNINNERLSLEAVLTDASAMANGASDTDAGTRATGMLSDANTVVTFLNNVINALNQAVPNTYFPAATIAADQTSLSAARTEVTGAISAVTAAKSAYDTAVAGAASAGNSATAGTNSDIAAAEANVKSAQGSLAAAQAALAKTIVRSPISGTIVSLPVTQGDFVSAYSQIATISNPGALYIDTQVTPDDAKTLVSGAAATINGSLSGIITSVAPAIDPTTGKIDVKVAIKGSSSSLTDGETVSLELARTTASTQAKQNPNAQITIPITAVKMLPDGPAVFTVTASSTLEPHTIQLGTILGDRIVVVSGLTNDMQIVADARGLTAGGSVILDSTNSPMGTSTSAE